MPKIARRAVWVRWPPEIMAALEAIAEKETRSLSEQILHYVKRCLREDEHAGNNAK